MLSEAMRNKLDDMSNGMISGRSEHSGYRDPLDLLGLLRRHPDLDETIDFWEFRKAYDWLSETARQNHRNGRHLFLDTVELAYRAGCSFDVLAAAATELGLKPRCCGSYAAFKFPPFKESSGSPAV